MRSRSSLLRSVCFFSRRKIVFYLLSTIVLHSNAANTVLELEHKSLALLLFQCQLENPSFCINAPAMMTLIEAALRTPQLLASMPMDLFWPDRARDHCKEIQSYRCFHREQ